MALTLSFDSLKAKIAGITSVLLVVPALINAGGDIYVSVLKLPRNEAERVNHQLFQKYFGKQPVVAVPLPIRHALGTVDARISVYDGGDVLMEYGDRSQWFAFPAPKREIGGLIAAAYADEPATRGIGRYRQTERVEGHTLIRERTYENGIVERQRIDTLTGNIRDTSTRSNTGAPNTVAPFGVIELDKKGVAPSASAATRCTVPNGGCTLVRPVAKGAQCFCATANGAVAGQAH